MPSISKINRILDLLRENARYGLSNKEIAETLDLPQSTCYRILASLKQYDYVLQRKTDMRYFLGFAHLRFAQAVLENSDEATVAAPYLDELHRITRETVFYAKYSGNYCVAMEIRGAVNTRIAVGQGEVMPLHCTAAGKAVLAFLPKKDRDRIYNSTQMEKHTPSTLIDRELLEKDLEEIRKRGVSYNLAEFHNGINALATPVFDRRGNVTGTIAVVGTETALNIKMLNHFEQHFKSASMDITRKIGGKYPEGLIGKGSKNENAGSGF